MQQNLNDIDSGIVTENKITFDSPYIVPDQTQQQRGTTQIANHFLTPSSIETISVKNQTVKDDKKSVDWELPEFESVSSNKKSAKKERSAKGLFGLFNKSTSPKTVAEYRQQGISLSEKKRLGAAAKMLEKAMKMGANDLECQLHLGLTYSRLGRIKEAITLLSDLNVKHGDDPGVATLLGKALLFNGLYQEAAEVMAPASANNPSRFNLHFYLGLAYAKLNEFDMAIDAWLKAIRINPTDKTTRQFLNRALDAKTLSQA
ncbi:MAG: tetratricopeptide repeat protein [Magnetococcales bacterium]|nr:tetratricopeptide repeat protein [Magnetococcales bacterium]